MRRAERRQVRDEEFVEKVLIPSFIIKIGGAAQQKLVE